METVLYEYHLNIFDCIQLFVPLIVGIGLLSIAIHLVKSKNSGKNRSKSDLFGDVLFKVVGFVFGPFCILIFAISVYDTILTHIDYTERLSSDNVYVVEGYVENYHPMPFEGHDTEHFEINGVYFSYSDYALMNGYHNSASYGGVVTANGQYLKIKYVVNDIYNGTENIILYIAEIKQ